MFASTLPQARFSRTLKLMIVSKSLNLDNVANNWSKIPNKEVINLDDDSQSQKYSLVFQKKRK